jgi:spore maturation protein CgeB
MDFLFVGKCDKERVKNIEQLGRTDVKVYGDQEWVTRSSSRSIVRTCFQNKPLFGDELALETSKAVGTFNFLRPQNIVEGSHNMRTFEIPSMHGLQLTHFTDEQAEFFEEDKEIIFFRSIEELDDKASFIKSHFAYAKKIKQQAYERCSKSGYSYLDRCFQIEKTIQQHLH